MKGKFAKSLLALSMTVGAIGTIATTAYAVEGEEPIQVQATTDNNVEAKASEVIDTIRMPKYDEKGVLVEQKVSDTLKAKLDTTNLVAVKDETAKTLTVKTQLKDVFLNTDYKNGNLQQVWDITIL